MKIGILGGTFDPIHYGHIKPALEVKNKLDLDEIWLMPNHIPPHKQGTRVDSKHRLAMAKLVCQQYDDFGVCDIEINRDTPSYTVTTLELLTQRYPEHQFYFIMGTDSFIQLASWYEWKKLFKLSHLVICRRPGWSADNDHPMMKLLEENLLNFAQTTADDTKAGKIFPINVTLQDISSTEIREELAQIDKDTVITANNSLLATNIAQDTYIIADNFRLKVMAALKDKLPLSIQAYILQHQLYR